MKKKERRLSCRGRRENKSVKQESIRKTNKRRTKKQKKRNISKEKICIKLNK